MTTTTAIPAGTRFMAIDNHDYITTGDEYRNPTHASDCWQCRIDNMNAKIKENTMTTYTLNCNPHTTTAKQRATTTTGTLEHIRTTLLDQAMQWGWNIEGWQHLIEQLEEGTAPASSESEVLSIASTVWVESLNHITLEPAI